MKLIFLHIPKAGGTTLESILLDRQSAGQALRLGKAVPPDEFRRWPQERRNGISLLMGHIPFGMHRLLGSDDVRYLTIFRDPVERAISHYYYIKRHPTHWLHDELRRRSLSLRDFALSDLTSQLDNGQVRLLAGCEDTGIPTSDDMVEKAIDNIQKWFVGFGSLERFDESLLLLKHVLCWNDLPVYLLRNVGHDKKAVSQEDRQAIRERNHYDFALYQWAQDEFSRRIGEIDGFAAELRTFEAANKAYALGYESGRREGLALATARSPTRRIRRKLKSIFS